MRGDNGTPIGFVSHVLDITEQLRAAEALRVAEVQFRSIFENAPIGMAIYSFDGAASTIVRVNAALCRLLGYSEGELVGMPAQTIADDEHIDADLDYARMNGLYPGQRIVVPRTYRAKDGRAVETERYLTITGDAKGIVVGAIVQIIDVTDRRAAERALNESEAMHRLLVHNLRNVALLLFDHDLRYTLVDGDHVMTGLGREARDLVGRTIRQLVDDPALVEYYEDLYRRALAGESTQWTIDRFGHNYDCHTGPVRDDVGNVIGGMTLLYEITEHRQLQSQLADSEARLSSLIENAADSMWSLDRDGKLTAFNSRFANEFRDSFGVDVSIGTSILDAVPVAARLRAKADLDATLAGEPVNAERAVVANGRERYMLLSQRPIISNGVITGASATAKDITGRRDMEIAEQRQREVVALLQSIATAANEASSSNAAIMRCLGLVAKFARWSVGHAFSIVGDELRSRPTWYLSESERFAAFVSFTDSLKARKGEGLAGEVLAAGKPVWKSSTRDVASFQRGAMAAECGLLTCFALPVFVGDEVVTVVEFFSERDEQPSDDMFAVMANVGVQLGRVIERERHGDLVRALSLTDELTALHNRRGFMVLANQQMRAIIRSRRPRCVMFADLDGLKRINDELGHEVGDRALVRFAGVLRDVFSEGDILSRFGGDEFVVFVDASIVDANVVVEKLRQRLLEHSAAHADEPALAASIGVVEINPDAMDTLDVVVSRADAEMYQNKRARRASHSNIVVPR